MNLYLFFSGLLTVILALIHSIVGEILIINPLQKVEGLPAMFGSVGLTKQTLRLAWHITTLLAFGLAAVLFYYSQFSAFDSSQIFVLKSISITYFASFFVALVGSRGKHIAWFVFLLAAILTWMGMNP